MQDFWFYIKLGFNHVMDPAAYDHILFLCALAIPFTFKSWKMVVLLATIFTVAHCLSLAMGVYDIIHVDAGLIEFLIPLTIMLTAIFNIWIVRISSSSLNLNLHVLITAFFGLIHGFGFSNYFKMLMAEEEEQLGPLLGFATGIEISQLIIILFVLVSAGFMEGVLNFKRARVVIFTSIIIALITIPMLLRTFPG